jgi:hypothetical protein
MFLGHFALALAAKRVEPRVSLGTTIAAAELADTIWPVLVLAGVEHVTVAPGDTAFTPLRFDSYPISHSLVTLALWGAAFGGLHWLVQRSSRAALLLAGLVMSHWLLDVISHRPDMPVVPWGGPKLGFGLWNSVPATLIVEACLFAIGLWLYASAALPRDAVGRWGFAGFLAFLILAYGGAAFGPPPPSAQAVAIVGVIGGALFVIWAAWVDKHRGRWVQGLGGREPPA